MGILQAQFFLPYRILYLIFHILSDILQPGLFIYQFPVLKDSLLKPYRNRIINQNMLPGLLGIYYIERSPFVQMLLLQRQDICITDA